MKIINNKLEQFNNNSKNQIKHQITGIFFNFFVPNLEYIKKELKSLEVLNNEQQLYCDIFSK